MEVQAADPYSEDAVEVFVDLKSDAIRLTKEYREAAKDLLSDEKYLQIRERIRNMIENILKNFNGERRIFRNRNWR